MVSFSSKLTDSSSQDGLLKNQVPIVTTDPSKLEAQAKKALGPHSYGYVAGGAGERATMDANRLAFRTWKIVPRMNMGNATRDLGVELFGEKYGTAIDFHQKFSGA